MSHFVLVLYLPMFRGLFDFSIINSGASRDDCAAWRNNCERWPRSSWLETNGLSGKLSNWRFCVMPKKQDLYSFCFDMSVLLDSNLAREATFCQIINGKYYLWCLCVFVMSVPGCIHVSQKVVVEQAGCFSRPGDWCCWQILSRC